MITCKFKNYCNYYSCYHYIPKLNCDCCFLQHCQIMDLSNLEKGRLNNIIGSINIHSLLTCWPDVCKQHALTGYMEYIIIVIIVIIIIIIIQECNTWYVWVQVDNNSLQFFTSIVADLISNNRARTHTSRNLNK